jgi:hypothetical protein
MGIRGDAHRVMVGRPERKRPLGRPRRRKEDNIKMGVQKLGREAWIELIWISIGTGGGRF